MDLCACDVLARRQANKSIGRLRSSCPTHMSRAHAANDYTKEGLAYYELALKNSFVMRDMEQYKGFPTILTTREIFEDVPAMADDIATKLFTVDGQNSQSVIMDIVNSLAQKLSARQLVDLITKIVEAF